MPDPVSATNWFSPEWSASDVADYSGVIPNTGPTTTAAPDASGGSGSFLKNLQNTLTNGISTLLTEKISAGLALTTASDLRSVNAAGQVTPKAAQQTSGVSTQTMLLIGGGALALVLVLALARKH